MWRTPSRPPYPRVSRSAPSAAGSGGLADQARARLGSTQVAVATPQLGAGCPSLPMISEHAGQPLVARPAAPLAASTPRALPSAWGSAEAKSDGDRRRWRARRCQLRHRLRRYGPGPGPIHRRGGRRLAATWAGVQRRLLLYSAFQRRSRPSRSAPWIARGSQTCKLGQAPKSVMRRYPAVT